jgi:uncharacterized protein (UPF0332 family)
VSSVGDSKRDEVRELWNLVLEKRSAAMILLREQFFNDSLSRSYYSAFHAVTMLFLLEDRAFSSHKQIIGMFNKEFVHTSTFPEQIARDLEHLFESRQTGDYDYHIAFDESDARTGIHKLERILNAIRNHVLERFGISLEPID